MEQPPDVDLVEWLETAISRAEARAGAATPGPWEAGGIGDYGWTVYATGGRFGVETEDSEQGRADAAYLAGNDPSAALRRCLADRKTLGLHRVEESKSGKLPGFCGHCGWRWPCPDVRNLAHNGYGYQESQ